MAEMVVSSEGDLATGLRVNRTHVRAGTYALEKEVNEHRILTVICEECGHPKQIAIDCGDRTCWYCNKRRSGRIKRAYHGVVSTMENPLFIALTLKRCKLTRGKIRDVRKYFTRLRHRVCWTAGGGIYQIEVGTVESDQTGNIHIHTIVDSPDMPKAGLRSAWKSITGDSFIVDIKRCWSPRGALYYLTEHMGKRIGKSEDSDLINSVLKGTRMVQGFGYLSKQGLSFHDSICEKCEATNSLYIDWEWENYEYPKPVKGF